MKGVPILLTYEDGESTTRWKPDGVDMRKFHARTCRIILLDGVGRPLNEFHSKEELFSGCIDILRGMFYTW